VRERTECAAVVHVAPFIAWLGRYQWHHSILDGVPSIQIRKVIDIFGKGLHLLVD
jgi:hypothetical protein